MPVESGCILKSEVLDQPWHSHRSVFPAAVPTRHDCRVPRRGPDIERSCCLQSLAGPPVSRLENIFQRELHDPAALSGLRARGDPSKLTAAERDVRISEANAIGHIERLCAKLDSPALRHLKLSSDRLIPFPKSWSSQAADSHIAVRPTRR